MLCVVSTVVASNKYFMGRPINHRYIGNGSILHYTVLRPVVQLQGVQGAAWMMRQTGSNKFLCWQITTGYTGVCQFVNSIVRNNQMTLSYRNIDSTITGRVARLTNLTVRDFTGNSLPWTLNSSQLAYSSQNTVYISDNGSEP
jgi:hypothetical protein